MSYETIKEKDECMFDCSEKLQKIKFNIMFSRKSLTLKNNLLNFTMEYKYN